MGDRVRTERIDGWGGTVIGVIENIVTIHRDGEPEDGSGAALFYSHELAPFTGRGRVLASRD